MTILIPTRRPEDWKRLLADPDRHWKEGRSAMSAALSWEAAQGLPVEIANVLGREARLLLAIPEHQVDLGDGGRPTQCDVFALVDLGTEICALSVEAKVDEPFGPTLGEWLAGSSPKWRERLARLLALLGAADPPPRFGTSSSIAQPPRSSKRAASARAPRR